MLKRSASIDENFIDLAKYNKAYILYQVHIFIWQIDYEPSTKYQFSWILSSIWRSQLG
jgi:hypothetical protein